MNARDYKPNYPGAYFHIYNRGVNKLPIFLDDQDYLNFLYRAKVLLGCIPHPKRTAKGGMRLQVLPKGSLDIICFCLMGNHFHFLLRQNKIDAAKMFIHRLCTSYNKYFNKKYDRVGQVFQDVYKSKNLEDDAYLTQLSAYIHLNPKNPFRWKYSSLPVYLGEVYDSFVETETLFKMYKLSKDKYTSFLLKQYNPKTLENADLLFDEK